MSATSSRIYYYQCDETSQSRSKGRRPLRPGTISHSGPVYVWVRLTTRAPFEMIASGLYMGQILISKLTQVVRGRCCLLPWPTGWFSPVGTKEGNASRLVGILNSDLQRSVKEHIGKGEKNQIIFSLATR